MIEAEVARRLEQIAQVFDLDELESRGATDEAIIRYYDRSAPAYRALHSDHGAIHMALNADGEFDRAGYYGQARRVAQWLDGATQARVLELGAGNGFNLAYLARTHSTMDFTGIDLVPAHVEAAQRSLGHAELRNARVLIGSFQALPFDAASFDLLFVIESLCHATDMPRALSEARRVLRPGGHFVVIDAWRTSAFANASPAFQRACVLTELSMSVQNGWLIDDWLTEVRRSGFAVAVNDDLTELIMPNLSRFERMAERYIAHPRLARASLRLLSSELAGNAIAGYLMPLTTASGVHTYRQIVLRPKV